MSEPNSHRQAARQLVGTYGQCDESICEEHDIDPDDLEDIVAKHGVEQCHGCGYWVESDECNKEGLCLDCQKI